ncbi:MAG TPA: V-type ATP synthase subunit I [Candidatus Tidjanibacter gallistercoris]|nr:V-type ATP synthase subunit I [Candidatus Tidjanibacter gallistercoris]
MIVRMSKYTFVLYHERQKEFLAALQELGLVDITTAGWEPDEAERAMLAELEQHRAAGSRFAELAKEAGFEPGEPFSDADEAFAAYLQAAAGIEEMKGRLDKVRREADELAVWGDFSPAAIRQLAQDGVTLRFFSVYDSEFPAVVKAAGDALIVREVARSEGRTYFVTVGRGKADELPFDAQEYRTPDMTAAEKREQVVELEAQSAGFRALMARAYASREAIEAHGARLRERLDFSRAGRSGQREAEGRLVVMEGWATEETSAQVDALLEEWPDVVYFKDKPTPEDDTPVVLKNNRFANPFEVIGQFYSLPRYGTMDLTAFFGPFYMVFFGFCLGDAGYGLILVLASFFLRRKKTEAMRQVANLTLLCGAASVLFGFLAGSFFGIQLAGLAMFAGMREKFFDTDMLFTLSLGLGLVQILFALVLNIVNVSRRFGFKYSLGTLGWLMILIGALGMMFLPGLGVVLPAFVWYAVMGIGAVLMIFLHNPDRNPLVNFGSGLWNTYNNVTGLLGDVLSYIRLFALCLSGGTLALVFNDLAFGLTADLPVVVSQLVAVIILLFGHSINLFMSALGAFVHPMRLTFVEFYKNAGFESTQREFAPLRKTGK